KEEKEIELVTALLDIFDQAWNNRTLFENPPVLIKDRVSTSKELLRLPTEPPPVAPGFDRPAITRVPRIDSSPGGKWLAHVL
ncbi:MAG: hypothetical protein ACRD1R_06955, partial [Acidobacteriota bacterium]